MDGNFVPNISFGPMVVKGLRNKVPKEKIFFDCHMMVSNPLQWIDDMAAAGGNSYTFHYEACLEQNNHEEVIKKIRESGMKVGMAIRPKTPVEVVYPLVDKLDMVLVMTVEPGFGGQSFMAEMMPKVEDLRSKYPNLNVEVDGGLGPATVNQAAEAGANVVVAGTSVYKSEDPSKTITLLREAIKKHLIK
ncbi:ribulose-phosphate 3-epimerase RPE1 [Sugiyamaella lignohabitans]|uniref:Ribulose-phosphate 3-epimerase n=1 Tax=Sugiyamaella lignohabitans TaxID=796027 RepID=A0A167DSX9_9ASCO|nr:ribulose-phosphate 3-epimerase RPE1 [Sugiyamaella lignohabitans]ANB13256.1 ribulose-phosphate 3-epimerase RPE1 [Sugiyamaella lignohabitans]